MIIQNTRTTREFFQMWYNAVDSGICPESTLFGGQYEQECLGHIVLSRPEVLTWVSKTKLMWTVDYTFVRHYFGFFMKENWIAKNCPWDKNFNDMPEKWTEEMIKETLHDIISLKTINLYADNRPT